MPPMAAMAAVPAKASFKLGLVDVASVAPVSSLSLVLNVILNGLREANENVSFLNYVCT
jgi:hypothetical protein